MEKKKRAISDFSQSEIVRRKQILRQEIIQKRIHQSEEESEVASSMIFDQLLSFLSDRAEFQQVLLYADAKNEVRTSEIADYCLKRGQYVYYPLVHDRQMDFYLVNSVQELSIGHYGILEPLHSIDRFHPMNPSEPCSVLMILPGVAFDCQCNRIGYGGGYYDRFLNRFSDHVFLKVALAYEFQILNHLPCEEHDRQVDNIVTQKRVISRSTPLKERTLP